MTVLVPGDLRGGMRLDVTNEGDAAIDDRADAFWIGSRYPWWD